MAIVKITEKQTTNAVKSAASLLITQQETADGVTRETLLRATLQGFIKALQDNGIHDGYLTETGLTSMYSELVKSVEAIDSGIRITFWDNQTEDIVIKGLAEDAIATTAEFLAVLGEDYDDNEEVAALVSDLTNALQELSALENALFQWTVDKARLNQLSSLAKSGNTALETADSEVVDIRTGYDGTTYSNAGNAVRAQIQDVYDSVATTAEFLAVLDEDYDDNEEVAALISDLHAALREANAFKGQIENMQRMLENIGQFFPDGGITNANLSPALQRPDNVVSAGTVAAMLNCAESYFNYAYTADGADSGIIYESHKGLYSESLGTNAANNRYSIVCSSFADAILNGIFFQNSRYNGNSKNIKYRWGMEFDDTGVFGTSDGDEETIKNRYLSSQNLARYAAEHGYLYAIDSNANIRAGDVVFSGNESDRYLGIGHVAIVINVDKYYCTVIEAWPSEKIDIDGGKHDIGLRINYYVPIKNYTYGATFPLGDVVNDFIPLQSVHDLSGNTTATTTIYNFDGEVTQGFYTVVCRGEFTDVPYISLQYTGAETSAYQSPMFQVGSDYYLTIYVQKPAVVSLRVPDEDPISKEPVMNTYSITEAALFKGYADITAQIPDKSNLKAGDDLDDCVEGVWYCKNAATAKAIIHAPLSEPLGGFRLDAVKMTNGDRYMQTVWYVGSPDKMYVRMYMVSGWTSWFMYSGETI